MKVNVSVVTPVYNSRDSILEVVACVRAQEVDGLEHIIIDDASTDGSADVIQGIAEEDPRIRLIRLGKNAGAAVARNVGIEAARGRYIAFLDSDDFWDPKKLKEQISFMERTGCALSYGGYRIVNKSNAKRSLVYMPPAELSYSQLLFGCPIGCLTAVYDSSRCGKVYMPLVRRGQDWGLWLKISRKFGPAQRYDGIYASYRVGGGSLSSKKISKVKDVWKIYKEQEGLGNFLAGTCLIVHSFRSSLRSFGIRTRLVV